MLLYVVLRQFVDLQSLGLIAARTASNVGALLRLAYFYAVGRPVAHSLVRLHPRTARGAPARRRCNGRFHALLRRQIQRIAYRYLPLRRLVRHGLVHDGTHPDTARVKLMEPADPGRWLSSSPGRP